jgi:hypothetical protein
LGTDNDTTLTPVKSTTERLTIPELLGGVKNYDYLPPDWENVKVIATVVIATKRTSLQSRFAAVATGNGTGLNGTKKSSKPCRIRAPALMLTHAPNGMSQAIADGGMMYSCLKIFVGRKSLLVREILF